MLQELLNEYEAGVEIRDVQLLSVDPPAEVIDAFNDVQRARQDRDTLINEAEAFRNDIVPRARGEAAQLISEAEAYASEVVNRAKGDADRFNSIYKSYKLNPEVTESRIYLETVSDSDSVSKSHVWVQKLNFQFFEDLFFSFGPKSTFWTKIRHLQPCVF